MSRVAKVFYVVIVLFVPLTLVSLYLLNPSETASKHVTARLFGFQMFHINGIANAPTLQPGDFVVVSTWSAESASELIGELIAFYPAHDDRPMIFRAIAGPNDTVSISSGTIFVNGELLSEPYVVAANNQRGRDIDGIELGPDQFLVLGDNRDNAADSRYFGPVRQSGVIGKVVNILSGE